MKSRLFKYLIPFITGILTLGSCGMFEIPTSSESVETEESTSSVQSEEDTSHPDKIEVLFHANGGLFSYGTDLYCQQVGYKECLSIPDTPKRDGYDFSYWSYNDKEWDFSTPVEQAMDLYANWIENGEEAKVYNVIFNANGGVFSNGKDKIEYNVKSGTILSVEEPTYEAHIFTGWELDGKPWDCSNEVKSNLYLYATWRGDGSEWRVELCSAPGFFSSGGQYLYITVKDGELIEPVEEPTQSGKDFAYWANNGTKWNFATDVVHQDLSLNAVWVDPALPQVKVGEQKVDLLESTYDFNPGVFKAGFIPEKTGTYIIDASVEDRYDSQIYHDYKWLKQLVIDLKGGEQFEILISSKAARGFSDSTISIRETDDYAEYGHELEKTTINGNAVKGYSSCKICTCSVCGKQVVEISPRVGKLSDGSAEDTGVTFGYRLKNKGDSLSFTINGLPTGKTRVVLKCAVENYTNNKDKTLYDDEDSSLPALSFSSNGQVANPDERYVGKTFENMGYVNRYDTSSIMKNISFGNLDITDSLFTFTMTMNADTPIAIEYIYLLYEEVDAAVSSFTFRLHEGITSAQYFFVNEDQNKILLQGIAKDNEVVDLPLCNSYYLIVTPNTNGVFTTINAKLDDASLTKSTSGSSTKYTSSLTKFVLDSAHTIEVMSEASKQSTISFIHDDNVNLFKAYCASLGNREFDYRWNSESGGTTSGSFTYRDDNEIHMTIESYDPTYVLDAIYVNNVEVEISANDPFYSPNIISFHLPYSADYVVSIKMKADPMIRFSLVTGKGVADWELTFSRDGKEIDKYSSKGIEPYLAQNIMFDISDGNVDIDFKCTTGEDYIISKFQFGNEMFDATGVDGKYSFSASDVGSGHQVLRLTLVDIGHSTYKIPYMNKDIAEVILTIEKDGEVISRIGKSESLEYSALATTVEFEEGQTFTVEVKAKEGKRILAILVDGKSTQFDSVYETYSITEEVTPGEHEISFYTGDIEE